MGTIHPSVIQASTTRRVGLPWDVLVYATRIRRIPPIPPIRESVDRAPYQTTMGTPHHPMSVQSHTTSCLRSLKHCPCDVATLSSMSISLVGGPYLQSTRSHLSFNVRVGVRKRKNNITNIAAAPLKGKFMSATTRRVSARSRASCMRLLTKQPSPLPMLSERAPDDRSDATCQSPRP